MTVQAVIGLATRGRKQMLRAALESVRVLKVPADVALTVVVVENDHTESCRNLVKTGLEGVRFIYEVESRIGIAYARNRVAEIALKAQADVLLFFDDDEMLSSDWLEVMLEAWRKRQGKLIGGPVRVHFDWKPESAYRAFVQKAIAHHYGKREKRLARISSRGGSVLVSTNNCLVDMELFTTHELRYSTEHHTGSDKRFYQDACELGIKTGWVASATVQDVWPRNRTSLRYNFFRASEQEKTRYAACEPESRLTFALQRAGKSTLFGILLALGLLPSGGYTIIPATRMAGRVWGLLAATMGSRSVLYKVPTGS